MLFQGPGQPKLGLKKDNTDGHPKVSRGLNPTGLNRRGISSEGSGLPGEEHIIGCPLPNDEP